MNMVKHLLIPLLSIMAYNVIHAQYFGQNKPTYEKFDFKVTQTPHFEIYQYLDNPQLETALANYTEQWYLMHQNVLKDTFDQKNPIIFYNDHADFQQTNTISGQVGIGTGGVTEGLRNRVIMPVAMSNQQTFHVLGHELVHAFQYHMIIEGDSTSLKNLNNLPLWMVEGLAEYMSIGRVDAHTAMWMRDAVLNDDIPTLRDLNNPKYFPYRWGQAFWAFMAGWKGDDFIEPYFRAVAKFGLENATKRLVGLSTKDLSKLWVNAIKSHFKPFVGEMKEETYGKQLIHPGNSGKLNIAPVISPNGRYLIFLSERNVLTTDLFLADAVTGQVIRKVASTTKDGHIDDFNYIESAGTWSPDSRQFAFVGVQKGENVLIIKEVSTGKTVETFPIKGIPAFTNPSWSPDGQQIMVTGLAKGQVDLYAVHVRTKQIKQLTNDVYSEMHPSWSKDGASIWFATDQVSYENGRTNGKWVFNLAQRDLIGAQTTMYQVFPGADNLNPLEGADGQIWFVSNRDGYRNIYKMDPQTEEVQQMTALLTGVTGITPFAPAMSIAQKKDRIVYSHYYRNTYSIYKARPEAFLNARVDQNDVDFTAATLPRLEAAAINKVDAQLHRLDQKDPALLMTNNGQSVVEKSVPYQSKFDLTYVGGGAGVGVGINNTFGTNTGLAGGMELLFGDILGHNQLFSSLSLNGEITDFGGVVGWINRKNRIQYGASLSHIPLRQIGGIGVGLRFISPWRWPHSSATR